VSEERWPQPPVDYTSRDFASFREHLIETIPNRVPEWTSRNPSDFGMVLVDLFSYIGDNLSFYADRIANEAFLRTAVRRRSVLDIAKMLNYQPTAGTAAQVELQMEVSESLGSVTVPRRTRVSTVPQVGEGDIVVFETDEEITLVGDDPEQRVKHVWATEGETFIWEELGERSTGRPGQRLALPYSPIVKDTVEVRIDEGAGPMMWRQVGNLLDAGPRDAVYQLDVDEEETTYLLFGDRVHGKVPATQAVVEASFRVGGGRRGNVAENTIIQFVDVVDGVLSVVNPNPARGGADPESTNDIRVNAPRAMAATNRAVSLRDHAVLALQVPGAARTSAEQTGDREVTVYVVPYGEETVPPRLRDALDDHFDTRKIFGHTVVIADPTYVGINITMDLQVKETFSRQRTQEAVEDALKKVLDFDRVDLNDRVTLSQVYRAFSVIGGVDFGVVTTLARDGGSGANDVDLGVNEFPVEGTVTINATGGVD